MKGNPTMGKAKSLKEKRELAAELSEYGAWGAWLSIGLCAPVCPGGSGVAAIPCMMIGSY
jgi:hypothetical protein